jgi:hypothetical protein
MYATSMDQSVLRWPNPAPLPHGERRRTIRQKLHTPVYVSFNTPQSGLVVDLSELIDLHEDGFAVQTAVPVAPHNSTHLEVNRAISLCLDLPETKKYIHGSGQVMWTDDTGRAGIRFSFLPEGAREVLGEWLFANLLIASTNYAARAAQIANHNGGSTSSAVPLEYEPTVPHLSPSAESRASAPIPLSSPAFAPIPTSMPGLPDPALPAPAELLSALDDVRREVRAIEARAADGPEAEAHDPAFESDAIVQLLARRAMNLTGASGAALALLTEGKMRCRASVGEPAPPVGSEVDVRSGLSGDCIHSGLLVSCEDSEADPRVDPEICRQLGIGSFMAVPIFSDFRVVGLLEVFSPYPRTFAGIHGTILDRLVELIPKNAETAAPTQPPAVIAASPANPPETNAFLSMPGTPVVDPGVRSSFDTVAPAPAETAKSWPQDSHEKDAPAGPAAPVPAARPSLAHFVLFVLVFGTIALVAGYLLAPTIDKHWMNSAQSPQPGQNLLQKAEAPSLPNAGNRPAHPFSLAELRQLAGQGDADAQYQMGILYHNGEGVTQSDTMAVEWFQRAADQGYVGSQSTLGAYYEAGRGVPQDFSKAYFWSVLAVAQGDENSKFRMQDLAARMTPAQVAQARQQAEAWLHSHTQAANSKPN